ncbi:MAG TPA: hypothetical protein VH640_03295 [Bryobacteraceae bacterium]|jgi:hypothetical protein
MADPIYHGKPITMFYWGDDAGAKAVAANLARDLGFDPVDAGPLTNARVLEPLSVLWIWLAMHGGMDRKFALTLVKQ